MQPGPRLYSHACTSLTLRPDGAGRIFTIHSSSIATTPPASPSVRLDSVALHRGPDKIILTDRTILPELSVVLVSSRRRPGSFLSIKTRVSARAPPQITTVVQMASSVRIVSSHSIAVRDPNLSVGGQMYKRPDSPERCFSLRATA